MFEAKIKWHRAIDELPEQSCQVIAAHCSKGEIFHVTSTPYSHKYKAFCCFDNLSEEDAQNSYKYSKEVKFWAYFAEFANALEIGSKTKKHI